MIINQWARPLNLGYRKVHMRIVIDNHHDLKIYTTGSTVSGRVQIHVLSAPVRVRDLSIELMGRTRTRIDGVMGPSKTSHDFLQVRMPIPTEILAAPTYFDANTTYYFPFEFNIPGRLIPAVCQHPVAHDSVREHHLRLPPSLGNWDKSDLSPEMARVSYFIRAELYGDGDTDRAMSLMKEAEKVIRVIPMVPEDPPLAITEQDVAYVMIEQKSVRRAFLGRVVGQMTVNAQEPSPAVIISNGHCLTPTIAKMDLIFEPSAHDHHPPPRVAKVESKITALTYFSGVELQDFPNMKEFQRRIGPNGRDCFPLTVSLEPLPIQVEAWQLRAIPLRRQDSGYESEANFDSQCSQLSSEKQPDTTGSRNVYATKVEVPITLSSARHRYLPTFHSCLTSRAYVLTMKVVLTSELGLNSSVTVAVPLQVNSAGPRVREVQAGGKPDPPRGPVMDDGSGHMQTTMMPEWHEPPPPYSGN